MERMEKLIAIAVLSAALLSQGCSSAPKPEKEFVDDFPIFPQGEPTATERLQTKRECQAKRKKRLPLVQNDFESQFNYSVFYSSKTNSCLVAKYTIWKNGGEYAAVVDTSGFTPGLWLEYYPTKKSKVEIERILTEQIDSLK